jgi:membrane protease YdiL (CAAX protease family)
LGSLISQINFSADIKAKQDAEDQMMNAFLRMKTFGDYAKAFTVMAIVPAIGEELFFRGMLLRFAKKRSSSMVFPILFSAAVFAFVHSNIYGFASIFLAGILLAVIYYLTQSLWCCIVAHMFYNGLQITLQYLMRDSSAASNVSTNTVPLTVLIAGVVLFSSSLFLLVRKKTPLPEGWENDYSAKELSNAA